MENQPTIVFDIGTSNVRVGFNTNEVAPKLQIPCVVGYPRQRAHVGMDTRTATSYVGVDLARYRSICDIVTPFKDSRIEKIPEMLAVIQQSFELLNVVPDDVRVVVTEPANATKIFRQDIGSLFLRDLRVSSLLLLNQSCCGVFGAGLTSGAYLDSGESATRCCAVVEGLALQNTFASTGVAGAAVTQQLRAMLKDSEYGFASEHAQHLKEVLCYVKRVDDDDATASLAPKEFLLPDGQTVSLLLERFTPPELLFDAESHFASIPGGKSARVHHVLRDTLMACDDSVRDAVAPSVVLGGGTSMTTGFDWRLDAAVRREYDLSPATRSAFGLVDTSVAPINSSWVGAAVFSSLSAAQDLFVTQSQIAEDGLGALERHRQVVDS